ncbi:MAG: 30S ribosomal protein S12 methylthiotransferase RimO [Firmicutes bacterium]|nr:30S ribosomal protein S12 methylthiotransferase RimO [Bacillota bacterium]
MKIGVVSLGCAKNLVDTEIVLGFLSDASHEIVSDPVQAEIIIINTCGFIEAAKEESINAILEMAAYKEKGSCKALVVMGCLSQRYTEELWDLIPEIDAMVGTNELDLIPEIIEQAAAGKRLLKKREGFFDYDQVHRRISTTGSHFAYLKVAEGCNHRCAFCVIPAIRGRRRSRSLESVLAEARLMRERGVQEVAVIAQDTTAYGTDAETNIVELLRHLAALDIPWIRLLYTYPTSITDELLELINETPNIVKYIDLPLQHVSGRMLKSMKRPGDFKSTRELIRRIRAKIPGVTIRSSFIVGFPGETEEDFQELLAFLKSERLNHVGIFKYSQEENSAAYGYPNQISEEVKEARYRQAMGLQQQISRELNEELVGSKLQVLMEFPSAESDLVMVGRHQGQAPDVDGVVYLGTGTFEPGQLVQVLVTEAHDYDLVGEEVDCD